jgi:hypothetical protein
VIYLCVFELNLDNENLAKQAERKRILKTRFRNLFARDILNENTAHRALLGIDNEDENVTVREVLGKMQRINYQNFAYNLPRFFRPHDNLNIEVVDEVEEIEEVEEEHRLVIHR